MIITILYDVRLASLGISFEDGLPPSNEIIFTKGKITSQKGLLTETDAEIGKGLLDQQPRVVKLAVVKPWIATRKYVDLLRTPYGQELYLRALSDEQREVFLGKLLRGYIESAATELVTTFFRE